MIKFQNISPLARKGLLALTLVAPVAIAGHLNTLLNADLDGRQEVNRNTSSKPVVSLLAGDIDNNGIINQFDALTIGINYNSTTPAAADLNNDGIINVLDLGLLAQNYLKSGALAW